MYLNACLAQGLAAVIFQHSPAQYDLHVLPILEFFCDLIPKLAVGTVVRLLNEGMNRYVYQGIKPLMGQQLDTISNGAQGKIDASNQQKGGQVCGWVKARFRSNQRLPIGHHQSS